MPPPERVFWRSETCCVWIGYDDDGALAFNGRDREHLDGYQYSVTVAPDQFEGLRRVLGAAPGTDVVHLVCAHVDVIMARGERTWLDDHGIERGFRTY